MEVCGTTYKAGGVVILSVDDLLPVFGLICDIIVRDVDAGLSYYL